MKYFFFIITASVCIGSHAQFFSGEITYDITLKPKNDSIDVQQIIDSKQGTKAVYLITNKYYKSTYLKNQKYNYSYIYHDDTKRMYDDYDTKPYITYRDSRKSNYEYYDSEVYRDSTSKVLDHDCFMVVTKSNYGTSRTFYSDGIKVDYKEFEGHKVGNWYSKLKQVDGCIALKTITEHENHYEIQEAIKIEQRSVDIDEFDLPKKPFAAAYSALDKKVKLKDPANQQIRCYQQKINSVSKNKRDKYTSYISFLLKKDGEILFVEPYEQDEDGYYKIALDIVETCGFEFIPGKINDELVDSQVFFPVEFFFDK